METFAPEVLATLVAEQFGDAYGEIVGAGMRDDLARRVERALAKALSAGKTAAVALCLERQALWVATEARLGTPELLRAEARARANEAAYLADAIQSLP